MPGDSSLSEFTWIGLSCKAVLHFTPDVLDFTFTFAAPFNQFQKNHFMALSTTIQLAEKPVDSKPTTPTNELSDVLLSMVLLSLYGAQMSKKTVRKLKRKYFWTSLKLKAKSFFAAQKKRDVPERTLIYILVGVAILAFVILEPVVALVLALIALILILAGII